MKLRDFKLAVIGLGYVGLPLAVEFGKKRPVIGFDIDAQRVNELKAGFDRTLETTAVELSDAEHLCFTTNPEDLKSANCYIVTVPTPIDKNKRPDLGPLIQATKTISKFLRPGNIVVYESTVYPGATEEECAPILEKYSGLKYITTSTNIDFPRKVIGGEKSVELPTRGGKKALTKNGFYLGYSPERINPGDKQHRLSDIKKVVSGSTPKITDLIEELYNEIIIAGTHKAESIRVAEAAKVIENTQRDLNIALVNELAIIFNRMGIDTEAVLNAAGSKWNFLPFRPGLVGGHCIGVDPYYLTHKAQEIGYNPEVILAGRRMNDGMSAYVASQLIKAMIGKCIRVDGARILIMGLTFKENCPDIRNTRIIDLINEIALYNINIDVFDPWVDPNEAQREYGVTPIESPGVNNYDAIVIAVAHKQFVEMGVEQIRLFCKPSHVLYDLKYTLPTDVCDLRL